ncbi:hypothetical protein ACHAWF_001963 [Thalassiosira exigua]
MPVPMPMMPMPMISHPCNPTARAALARACLFFSLALLLALPSAFVAAASGDDDDDGVGERGGGWRRDPAPSASCALLYFGIGRKFRDVAWPTAKEHLLDANPHCDVFVHTYNVTTSHDSGRKGDGGGDGRVSSEELLLLVDGDRSRIAFETEEEFRRKRDLDYYRTLFPRPSSWEYPTSIDNMIRQWHSIDGAWAKMTAHEESIRRRYDRVGLFRPDVLYTHPISIGDRNEVAVIPAMMYRPRPSPEHWGGYNDRMFYGTREYAESWATERFDAVKPYLEWQKSNKHYAEKSGLHSEDFLRWMLVMHWPMPLTIKPVCFKRVRTSGAVKTGDCSSLQEGNVMDPLPPGVNPSSPHEKPPPAKMKERSKKLRIHFEKKH